MSDATPLDVPARPFTTRTRRLLLGACIAGAAFIVTLVATADRLPRLDAERLRAARARWQAHEVAAYDLAIEVSASELSPTRYALEVRPGRAPALSLDGQPTGGDPQSYTVGGLFALLERELEMATDPARNHGAPAGYRAHILARFDRHTGVPVGFRRVVGGTGRWAEWQVVEFTPRPE